MPRTTGTQKGTSTVDAPVKHGMPEGHNLHVTVVTLIEGNITTATGWDVLETSTSGVHKAAGVTAEQDGIGNLDLMTEPIAGPIPFLGVLFNRYLLRLSLPYLAISRCPGQVVCLCCEYL